MENQTRNTNLEAFIKSVLKAADEVKERRAAREGKPKPTVGCTGEMKEPVSED